MAFKQSPVELSLQKLEKEIENFIHSVSFYDAVRMEFLEQSARYLGVYVENKPSGLLDIKEIN